MSINELVVVHLIYETHFWDLYFSQLKRSFSFFVRVTSIVVAIHKKGLNKWFDDENA